MKTNLQSYTDAKAKGISLPEDTRVPEGFQFYEYKPRNQAPKNAKNQTVTDPPPPVASAGPSRTSTSIENPQALASTAGPSRTSTSIENQQALASTARPSRTSTSIENQQALASTAGPSHTSTSIENQQALASATAGPSRARVLLSPTPLLEDLGLSTQTIAIRPQQTIPAYAPPVQSHIGNLYDTDSDIDAPPRAGRSSTSSSQSTYQAGRPAPSEHSGNSDWISRQSWHPYSDVTDTESSLDSHASSR